MKTRKKTEILLEYCRVRLADRKCGEDAALAELVRRARESRLRISGRLLATIREATAATAMNELLHSLSAEIRDRNLMMLLYDVLDRIVKQTNRARSRKSVRRQGRRRSLEEEFRTTAPERFSRVGEALREEARLRDLPEDPSVWPHHCHIWKNHFDYLTGGKLRKLLAMSDEDFHLTVCRFLTDLAFAARTWRNLDRFDWQRFSYAGISESDMETLFNPRRRHLATLALSADATEDEIRKRYKELARRHHPDLGGDAGTMVRINLAYAALTRQSSS